MLESHLGTAHWERALGRCRSCGGLLASLLKRHDCPKPGPRVRIKDFRLFLSLSML